MKPQAAGYYLFDGTGNLVRHVRLDGKTVSYAQSGNTLTVTASPGERKIVYTKDATSGMYVSALLPDAQLITFNVDAFGAVKSVTYPDAKVRTYLYNELTLRGTSTEAPVRLTGRVDENGVRHATFTYSTSGDALSTERAGGVDKYSISVQSPNVTLTTPLGSTRTLRWETGPDGERRMTSQSQPAGSGSSAASSVIAYDAKGNKARVDDFAARSVCYAHDLNRNLETTRVEGLVTGSTTCSTVTASAATLPSNSRKISTQWHPDWRLPARVAGPGKIITYVYNGQPDPTAGNATATCAPANALLPDGKPIAMLCKQVEQATTDANGGLAFAAALQSGVAAVETKWTYNSFGQTLTVTEPDNQISTYTYYSDTTASHTLGDLQTFKGPTGLVTTINSYDKSGRMLQMTDLKGIVTAMTYTPRGLIKTISTTAPGQPTYTTTYTYDNAGQLKGVSDPDGTTISYTYDAAHRLIGATDAKGNSVSYTLDNMGNRINEQLKDPGGVLQRSLSRSFDALNRVQQLQLQ
ncbi:MAG: RHS repeat protein [Pseudomonadota bacterium]